nr:MAG TPA: hypothetical protein [Caudoviricetes sp.]
METYRIDHLCVFIYIYIYISFISLQRRFLL